MRLKSNLQQCECKNTAAITCAKICGGKPKIQVSLLLLAHTYHSSLCTSYLPFPTQPCPPTASTSTSAAPPSPTARTFCGSRGMAPCPEGQTCIADPDNLSCSLIADCPGFCVQLNGPFCGGIAGIECPEKDQVCVDDPRDDCDPQNGGADCDGTCVRLNGSSSASGA